MNDTIDDLLMVMRRLRAPDGCPWDKEQTHVSLMKSLISESSEFLDAAANGDKEGMKEELGDLLMNIVLHSVIAEENHEFSLTDVIQNSTEKMIRRHPHVFGNEKADNSDQVQILWDKIKSGESSHENRKSILDGIPIHYPAVLAAEKMQKKTAKYGFDWGNPEPVLDKIQEELDELKDAYHTGKIEKIEEELGDLIFSAVNFGRLLHSPHSPEEILRNANQKFANRFKYIEQNLANKGISLENASQEQMESLWQEAKKKGL